MRLNWLTIFAGWAIWANSVWLLAAELNTLPQPLAAAATWPEPTNVSRPWTRWWWLGSAVDEANLTRLLETYRAAGLGGVEITSIYGVVGAEPRELSFLSDRWLAAVRHTLREAQRLGLGVDLPTGSGWRTGGPSVTDADGNRELVIERTSYPADKLPAEIAAAHPNAQAVVAYNAQGERVDLEAAARGAGEVVVYTVTSRWSRDNVKRPAPGGEGKNINPLSQSSTQHFLDYFAEKLADLPAAGIRSQFHDSYEYEGNWCDDFLSQFEQRRGYKLQDHLPALHGEGDPDQVARIKHDYRETVSDLVLDNMIVTWTDWSHAHGMKSRNQSHGSPANWLDLYAACDIPETESFGRLVGGDTKRLVFMFASSAAHVMGKPLVSAESATWLDEHFNVTLAEVKEIVDRLLLGGVNHVVYHGTAYSPADAAWPGWLFYASTQFNPQNPIWRDFPALNQYVTRAQSVLQATQPDNDILLYWPIHDFWQDPRGLRRDIRIHNSDQWLDHTEFGKTADWLLHHGYTFDYISDRQLAACRVEAGRIVTPGGRYATLIVPGAKTLPLATGRAIVALAEAGTTVISCGEAPRSTPGWRAAEEQPEFEALAARFMNDLQPGDGYQQAALGKGRIMLTQHIGKALAAAGIRREAWSEGQGLEFIRQRWEGGAVYFIKNTASEPFDARVKLATPGQAALLMDPRDGRVGVADVDTAQGVRLQLAPGETVFVKTYDDAAKLGATTAAWRYEALAGEPSPVEGMWGVEFIAGGPELPTKFNTQRLASWTELAGEAGERFAGTARYTIRFRPDVEAKKFVLDLGHVAESAQVKLNGAVVGTLFAPPYRVVIEPRMNDNNVLEIDVTSVAANRIRDLDRRGVKWRIFKDINLVNINYRPFDASNWPVRAAGLLGPVTITPLDD